MHTRTSAAVNVTLTVAVGRASPCTLAPPHSAHPLTVRTVVPRYQLAYYLHLVPAVLTDHPIVGYLVTARVTVRVRVRVLIRARTLTHTLTFTLTHTLTLTLTRLPWPPSRCSRACW